MRPGSWRGGLGEVEEDMLGGRREPEGNKGVEHEFAKGGDKMLPLRFWT